MTTDALDPGPNFDYPNLPRTEDGRLDVLRMPIGLRRQNGVLIDLTPHVRTASGELVPVTEVLAP